MLFFFQTAKYFWSKINIYTHTEIYIYNIWKVYKLDEILCPIIDHLRSSPLLSINPTWTQSIDPDSASERPIIMPFFHWDTSDTFYPAGTLPLAQWRDKEQDALLREKVE